MRCVDCGNISRFIVFKLVLKKIVLDFHSNKEGLQRSAIEYERETEESQPLAIQCIQCDAVGSSEDFTYTKQDDFFTDPGEREGHNVPEGIPPLDEIEVKVKF